MASRLGRCGRQPRTSSARVDRATRTGGSPARRGPMRTGMAAPTTRFRRRDDLADREAAAVPEIADQRLVGPRIARRGGLDRPRVRVGQVGDMDVVAQAGPVRGRVVVAEDRQVGRAFRRGQDVRDEVGLGPMDLADGRGRTGHVEVAKAHAAETVGLAVPGQRALEGALRLAVRIDRTERGVLRDRRRVGNPVDGRGRGEDEPLARRPRAPPRGARSRRPRCRGSSGTGRRSIHRPASGRRSEGSPRSRAPGGAGSSRPDRRTCPRGEWLRRGRRRGDPSSGHRGRRRHGRQRGEPRPTRSRHSRPRR